MAGLVKKVAVVSDEPFFIGPDGKRITLADLPPRDLLNLSSAQKSMVVAAVCQGLITLEGGLRALPPITRRVSKLASLLRWRSSGNVDDYAARGAGLLACFEFSVAPAGADALALASSSSRWASRSLVSASAADIRRLARRIASALARVEYATWVGSLILVRSSSIAISRARLAAVLVNSRIIVSSNCNLPRDDVGNPVNHV